LSLKKLGGIENKNNPKLNLCLELCQVLDGLKEAVKPISTNLMSLKIQAWTSVLEQIEFKPVSQLKLHIWLW
jgi:DNA-binding XRE family transcriptional regulator